MPRAAAWGLIGSEYWSMVVVETPGAWRAIWLAKIETSYDRADPGKGAGGIM